MQDSFSKIQTFSCNKCYLCDGMGELLYCNLQDSLFGVAGDWNLRQCSNKKCDLMWLDPMPDANEIEKLYENYYTHKVDIREKAGTTDSFRNRLRYSLLSHAFGYQFSQKNGFENTLGFLLSKISYFYDLVGRSILWLKTHEEGKLLDIGCGNGKFLLNMRDLGWEAHGTETDLDAVRVCQKEHGLQIYNGLVEELALPSENFDAATMIHVIEHLSDPLMTLKVIFKTLKPGGRLVLVTPNSNSLGHSIFGENWRGLEIPRHLHIFSQLSLRSLVRSAGFSIIDCRTNAGGAHHMWAKSAAIKNRDNYPGENPDDACGKYFKISGRVFSLVENILANWPLKLQLGEELVLIATKPVGDLDSESDRKIE